jgi:hypothetical protein
MRPSVELDRCLEAALDGTALLFTGAGFSFGATNVNKTPPMGSLRLARALGDACLLDETIELDIAADFFQEEKGVDALITLLCQEYKISSVARHHLALASVPWIRTYTTNYDDVYELACKSIPRTVQALTPRMTPEDVVLSSNDCVHINGFIHDLSKTTIRTSFKLTRTSYLTDTFAANPWSELLRVDLAVAKAVVFIGYSLYDLDISRFLYPDERLRAKTVFIVSTTPTRIELRNLDRFGAVFPIGVDGVAARLESTRGTYSPKSAIPPVFTSFDASVLPSPLRRVTDTDVFSLLMYGTLNENLLWHSSQPATNSVYAVNRAALDELKARISSNAPTIVIHSELGNGKTVLIEQLRCWLSDVQRHHFVLRATSRRTLEEIRTICQAFERPVIIIENYETRLDLLKEITRQRRANSTLVLTSRTSAHDVRFRDLSAVVGDFVELDANRLSPSDIEQFATLLSAHGLWGDFAALTNAKRTQLIAGDCRGQIRDVLLRVLESRSIRDRLSAELSGVEGFEDVYEVLIGIFILQYLAVQPNGQLLMDLFGPDTLLRLRELQSVLASFLDVKSGDVRARSSILSEFVLRNLANTGTVLDTLIKITEGAARHSGSRYVRNAFRDILIAIVRFSNLQGMLPERGRREAIIEYYESVKNLGSNQSNAHFWVQYAVARVTLSNFGEAGQYFRTAYSLASRIPGYDTSYIDNHYARYLLLRIISEPRWAEPIETFREAARILRKQARESENRHYPFRVSSLFLDFYKAFETQLNDEQRGEIRSVAQEILENVARLPARIQEVASVQDCVRKLDELLGAS